MDELKACPFCRGTDVRTTQHHGLAWSAGCWQDNCGATVMYFNSEAEAITAWNTRHAPELEEALKEIEVLQSRLVIAFLQGAKWWMFHETTTTMFASERDEAIEHAEKMLAEGRLGVVFLIPASDA